MAYQSVARQVNNILGLYAKRAFNTNLPIELKPAEGKSSRTHHYESDIAQRLYRMHQEQHFANIEQDVTPKILADEVLTLLEHTQEELEANSDEFGVITVRLSDRLLESYTNSVAQEGEYKLLRLQATTKHSQLPLDKTRAKVILPTMEMFSPVSLAIFRKWLHLEWIARTGQQLLGYTVKRSEVVIDNSEFIGIVMALILEKRPQKQITMADLAKFLAEKSLTTRQAISNLARETLGKIATDSNLKTIYDNMKNVYSRNRSRLFAGILQSQLFQTSRQLQAHSELQVQESLLVGEDSDVTYLTDSAVKSSNSRHIRVKVQEADSHQRGAIAFVEELTRTIVRRLQQTVPGMHASIDETVAARWLRYYLSRIPTNKAVMIENCQSIASVMLTRAEQRNDLAVKIQQLGAGPKQPFKIANRVDREFAWLLCRVGDSLEQFDFAMTHVHLDRMQQLLKANSNDYTRTRAVWAATNSLYKILGMT